jgi:hypothetical protein
MDGSEPNAKKTETDERQAAFDRRYRLLELKERREDRALKRRELELSQGQGIKFTSSQATVAGAVLVTECCHWRINTKFGHPGC